MEIVISLSLGRQNLILFPTFSGQPTHRGPGPRWKVSCHRCLLGRGQPWPSKKKGEKVLKVSSF